MRGGFIRLVLLREARAHRWEKQDAVAANALCPHTVTAATHTKNKAAQ